MAARIEEFASLIPDHLLDKPGRVFYSGRRAFESPSDLYILGLNSGGDPNVDIESIREHTDAVFSDSGAGWSRYVEGSKPFHRRMRHLFQVLDRCPNEVPASNLLFLRSKRFKDIPKHTRNSLITECWSFHKAVIDTLKVRVVVCLGKDSGEEIGKILRAGSNSVDCFTEEYESRNTQSFTYRNDNGLSVVQLTHPSYADWTSPAADPTKLVQRALDWAAANP